jgi:hypothetical protein
LLCEVLCNIKSAPWLCSIWSLSFYSLERYSLWWRLLGFLFVVTALLLLRRFMKPGNEQFDDLCVSVGGFVGTAVGTQTKYHVNMRISSRARGTAQRQNNLAICLSDDPERRYDPVSENSYQPFNVLLRPGESVVIARTFRLPVEARAAVL